MTIEETIKAVIGPAVREAVRAEVQALLGERVPSASDYLTVNEAAGLAKVHPETVRVWIRDGRLKGYHAGRGHRILRQELNDFLCASLIPLDDESLEARAAAILNRKRGG